MPFTVVRPDTSQKQEQTVKTAPSLAEKAARDRAIRAWSALGKGAPGAANAQAEAVRSPNAVSVEEMGAIKAPEAATPVSESAAPEASAESQNITSESSSAEATSAESAKAEPEAPLSSQYAQLARKERALRQQAQEMKQREAALKAREEALAPKAAQPSPAVDPRDEFKAMFKKDPMKALSELGMSYDELTEASLNAPDPKQMQLMSVIERLEAKIASLEDGQKKTVKTFEESQQQAYKQAVNQIKADAKKLVYSGDTYETIKATNSVDDVVDLIETTFKDGMGDEYPPGTLLSVDEAARIVEDYLTEEAVKLAKLKKIQEKIKPVTSASAPAAPAKSSADAPKQPQQTAKTLTNAQTASRPLTARERAIAAFRGEKKVS